MRKQHRLLYSACRLFLQKRFTERTFLLRKGKKGRIELDKCRINRSMSRVAGVTGRSLRNQSSHFVGGIEIKERPLSGKSHFVLNMDFESHNPGSLKMSLLID